MSTVEFIAQRLRTDNHYSKICHQILTRDAQEIVISTAYAKANGVYLLQDQLRSVAVNTKVFVGIRNGATSKQALEALLNLQIETYSVDAGSQGWIFHPKVWVARRQLEASAIIGSANMTSGGLLRNIETSVGITLDLNIEADIETSNAMLSVFNEMPNRYPRHVTAIDSQDAIDSLFEQHLIEDESVRYHNQGKGSNGASSLASMPVPGSVTSQLNSLMNPPLQAPTRVPGVPTDPKAYELVWESKPLSQRDLNVPSGTTTNETGSMLLKKGNMANVNFQHYFRDDVFSSLTWVYDTDPNTQHIERASAKFHFYISSIYCGAYTLKLSHNTDTRSRTYIQRNAMTSLHWNRALSLIRNRSLLGLTLRLYRKNGNQKDFIIEID